LCSNHRGRKKKNEVPTRVGGGITVWEKINCYRAKPTILREKGGQQGGVVGLDQEMRSTKKKEKAKKKGLQKGWGKVVGVLIVRWRAT